jgi:AmmeMemoRadiSam system protein B
MLGRANIGPEARFNTFVEILQEEMVKRRTVIVASGDLAHLGPAFDGPPMDAADYARMQVEDELLIDTLSQGDADNFFKFMQAGQYERNICGLAPFYFTLKLLGQTQGHLISYDRCPADMNRTSFVSVCGMVLD